MTELVVIWLLVAATIRADAALEAGHARAEAWLLLRDADPLARALATLSDAITEAVGAIGTVFVPAFVQVGDELAAGWRRLRVLVFGVPPCYCGWHPDLGVQHRHVARMQGEERPPWPA